MVVAGPGQQFVCAVCGYVYDGEAPPGVCPVCAAGAQAFLAFHAEEVEIEFE